VHLEEIPEMAAGYVVERLRRAGLRPTRQRILLGVLLFAGHDKHVTAESLYEDAVRADAHVSLATIYNTLNQFTSAGLLRSVAVDGARTYFDTNTTDHHHFYCEWDGSIFDIPDSSDLAVVGVPAAPEGTAIARVDVVVRLKNER
jgi:Fur family transcriptional regulator, iron response regulator